MITIDGVQYRNLEEQVKKNKDDIQYILEEEGVLNEFGIHIVDEVASSGDLPDPTTYEGEFGDAYAVGTTTPYTLYIYTRANGEHPTNYWFNIGQFPLPGPTGAPGPAGEDGATGLPALQDMGHITTSTVPIIGMALGTSPSNFNRTPVVGDTFFQLVMGLNGTSAEGRSWITNNQITSVGSLANYKVRGVMETTGAQGPQGNPGAAGSPGAQGPQGPIGPQGNPGQSFVIAGTVANEGQLPDPSTVADNIAYLVGTAAPYDLYVQLQDSSEWFNAGIVEGVQGPQGPQGPMPPLVDTRGNSTTDAISQQGIENIFYNSGVTLGANSNVGSHPLGSIAIGDGSNASVLVAGSMAIGYQSYSGGGTAIGKFSTANDMGAIAIGESVTANTIDSVAIGHYANANVPASILGSPVIAIGAYANVTGENSIQLGRGNNNTNNTFQVGKYPLLDLTTGFIPSDRIQGGGGGGGDVTVVQDLGTSTTSVISQNGINNLLRGNNALLGDINLTSTDTTNTILIGTNAHDYISGSVNCIAIGTNTEAGAIGDVAIGANTHVYSSSYNCIAIGPNVTIGDGAEGVIAFGHDFMVSDTNALIVQGRKLVNLITGKIERERLPADIPTVTDNGDGTISITLGSSTYKIAVVTE